MPAEEEQIPPKKLSFQGSCFCGAASFRVEGEPLISVYCHCTVCQRLTGCVLVHGLHYPTQSFAWTHENPDVVFAKESRTSGWQGWRCQYCYTFIAGQNTSEGRWSIKSSHFKRGPSGRVENWESIKPTAHIFYGTRMLDVHDDLPKWEGYENKSTRMHADGIGEEERIIEGSKVVA